MKCWLEAPVVESDELLERRKMGSEMEGWRMVPAWSSGRWARDGDGLSG